MLNQQIVSQIRHAERELKLDRFLAEPTAHFTRVEQRGEGRKSLHYVALFVADLMVASATSSKGYADALEAALWALEIWRQSVRDEING